MEIIIIIIFDDIYLKERRMGNERMVSFLV